MHHAWRQDIGGRGQPPTAVGWPAKKPKMRVANGRDMGCTSDAVRDLLRQRHRLGSDSPDDFMVRDLAAAQRAQSRSAFLMTLMLVVQI